MPRLPCRQSFYHRFAVGAQRLQPPATVDKPNAPNFLLPPRAA